MNPIKTKLIFVLVILFCVQTALALDSDRKQPAYLHADQGAFNQKTGNGVYTGHVKLDQGSTHVRGNKMFTYNNKHNKLYLVKVYGKPAHYRTLPEAKKPELFAHANEIIYHPLAHYVELIGKAQAKQGGNVLSGPKLLYYTQKQLVLSPKDSHGQTSIIIPPSQEDKTQ